MERNAVKRPVERAMRRRSLAAAQWSEVKQPETDGVRSVPDWQPRGGSLRSIAEAQWNEAAADWVAVCTTAGIACTDVAACVALNTRRLVSPRAARSASCAARGRARGAVLPVPFRSRRQRAQQHCTSRTGCLTASGESQSTRRCARCSERAADHHACMPVKAARCPARGALAPRRA